MLVADTTGAARTIGVDSSEPFLDRARTLARPGVEFVRHDVTALPLPHAPADLVYARYMLAHLAEPETVMGAWATQLRDGGRLLLDENEHIATDHAVLGRYEQLVTEVLAARDASMHVGAVIGRAELGSEFRRLENRVVAWRIPEATAARLYLANFTTWRHDDYVVDRYAQPTLDELARDLAAVVESGSKTPVEFGLRQVAFERRP